MKMLRPQRTAIFVLLAIFVAGGRTSIAAPCAFASTAADRAHWAFQPTEREPTVAAPFLAPSPMSELCRVLFNLNEFV